MKASIMLTGLWDGTHTWDIPGVKLKLYPLNNREIWCWNAYGEQISISDIAVMLYANAP
jgi:hypothetical protein